LQDWIIIGRLFKTGYRDINITLVDPELKDEKYKKFTDFFKKVKAGNINISTCHTIDKMKGNHSTFDAIMAIDFDDLLENKRNKQSESHYGWVDIVTAQKKLNNTGKLYLGHGQDDLVIDANGKVEALGKPGIYSAIFQDLQNDRKTVSIAASQYKVILPMLFPVITKLVAEGVKTIHITIVGKDDHYGYYPTIKEIKDVLEGYIPNGVSLIIDHTDKLLGSQKLFDYVVTGSREKIAQNAECTSLLNHDGSIYTLQELQEGCAINKITKNKTTRLLKI